MVAEANGVRLGATEADVRRVHPDLRRTAVSAQETFYSPIGDSYVAAYLMDGGRVSAIIWFTLPEKDLSADNGPPLSEPAGDSPETAILDVQKNETERGPLGARLAALPSVRRHDAMDEVQGRDLAAERTQLRCGDADLSDDRRDADRLLRHHAVLRKVLEKKPRRDGGAFGGRRRPRVMGSAAVGAAGSGGRSAPAARQASPTRSSSPPATRRVA